MIPESFIQELLNRVDVIDVIDKSVPLKKAGSNYVACCPFHQEKSPSFTVSPSKQFYHCFGCGAHGSALSFLIEYQGMSFVDAVEDLAKSVGLTVPQDTQKISPETKEKNLALGEALHMASQYYQSALKKSERAIEYLKKRGLTGQIAKTFQLGYAPQGWQNLESVFKKYDDEALNIAGLVLKNDQGKRYDRFRDRIMFPIHNMKGEIIGFGGRVINPDDTPKYYNSPETPLFQKSQELYGLFAARRSIREKGCVLVVEGYMDVVGLAQFGVMNAVATLGTATSAFHIKKLMRQTDTIIFCFDGDHAGKAAAWRAMMNALPSLNDKVVLKFLFLPEEHDPDSFIRAHSKEAFESMMHDAMPLSQYLVQHLTEKNHLATQEDKVKFLNEAEPILKEITAPKLSLLLRKRFAELLRLNDKEMDQLLYVAQPQMQTNKTNIKTKGKLPSSIKRKFILLLILKPHLAITEDLALAQSDSFEDDLLKKVLALTLNQPESKPSSILHGLKSQVDSVMMDLVNEELTHFDDQIHFESEIEGARKVLLEQGKASKTKAHFSALKDKPLSSLTEEEKEHLKTLTQRPKTLPKT
ncbi:MAG: DNA primase [Methylophilaceae bacterium]|jgi:DNA primase|nr:DNA primase [Methylophilaceae bacterium]NDF81400.1 DNA primase [Methylophilaceae bacterium]